MRLALCLAVLVTGCAQKQSDICGVGLAVEPPFETPVKDIPYRRAVAFACVERWAARLSRGPDTPSAISEAVLGACEDSIAFYVEERSKALKQEMPTPSEYERFWRRRATYIAVQTRAGGCYKDA